MAAELFLGFEDLAHRLYLRECLFTWDTPGRGNSKLWYPSLFGEFSVNFWLSTWVAECWIKAKKKEPEERWCGCTLNLRKGIKALFSWINHVIHTAAFQVLEQGAQEAGSQQLEQPQYSQLGIGCARRLTKAAWMCPAYPSAVEMWKTCRIQASSGINTLCAPPATVKALCREEGELGSSLLLCSGNLLD